MDAFARCDEISAIILVGAEGELNLLREIGEQYSGGKLRTVVPGGSDRQSSVRNGLVACEDYEFVAIHDAARPCVTPQIIHRVIAAAQCIGGFATAAIPLADTLFRVIPRTFEFEGGQIATIDEAISREGIWAIQTPQVFHLSHIKRAHDIALQNGFNATDDMGIAHRKPDGTTELGGYLVTGSPENLKVTRPEDLALAEAILMRRAHLTPVVPPSSEEPGVSVTSHLSPNTQPPNQRLPPFRIGHGYDVHQFARGRKLFLGGVEFAGEEQGLLGHSDADVVLHALCDALLGAAGMPDIGKLFPPSDMRHKDRRSTEFLDEVKGRLDTAGWDIGNVDITILAEKPKIGPKAEIMKETIGVHLGIENAQIGIKATTNEGMGFVGRSEGIAVHSTVLLFRSR